MKKFLQHLHDKKGGVLIPVIAFMTIGIIILSGFIGWGTMSSRVARHTEQREQALAIAEAGIGYYRWHLAHAPSDFQDGTGGPGPYIHPFYDKDGVQLGSYSLDITQPVVGSTLVTITSTGTLLVDPSVHRTIQTRVGKPSFAKFAVLSNSDISIGAQIWGPMHSNGFLYLVSGNAYNLMTSSQTKGNTTVMVGGGSTEWGVFTASDPTPPASLTTTTAMFVAGRDIGIPAVDFAGITVDLNALKAAAIASGKYYAAAPANGYHIVLNNDDTYNITTVTTLVTPASLNSGGTCRSKEWWNGCADEAPNTTWSIATEAALAPPGSGVNVPFPANGIIFVEDNVWIDGSMTSARLTVVAANLGVGSQKNIIVNNDLVYASKTGAEVLGLIAQNNFWVGAVAANDLDIYAAIIAQSGRVSRHGYDRCVNSTYHRNSIYFYGMFASNQRYAYGGLCGTPGTGGAGLYSGFGGNGFGRTYEYDPNLLYAPPPSFPLTTDQYEILSWDEL